MSDEQNKEKTPEQVSLEKQIYAQANEAYNVRSKRDLAEYELKIADLEARMEAKLSQPAAKVKEAKPDALDEVEKLKTLLRQKDEAETKSKEDGLVMSTLKELGVMNEDVLFDHLHARGMLVKNKSGELGMKVKKEWGDDVVSLKNGLSDFLKTDKGKSFLPPTGAQGSGSGFRNYSKPVVRETAESRADKRAQAAEMFRRITSGQGPE